MRGKRSAAVGDGRLAGAAPADGYNSGRIAAPIMMRASNAATTGSAVLENVHSSILNITGTLPPRAPGTPRAESRADAS